MERLCPKFFFLFGWLLFLPQLVSAFTISVYKDGYNVKTDFSDVEGSSDHEMVATVKITNYTGASDYKFWISDSENFNNAQSKNVDLDDYLNSTCSRGTIELTVYIYSNSSEPNWNPHGVECKQIDDNISNLVVSVHKNGFDARSTFTKVDDTSDEMVATVYIEDYTGNAGDYKFWVGFGGWSDGVSDNFNLGDYLLSECEKGNIYVTLKVNRNSTAKNLNPHDVTCKENHGIYIYSSTFYVDSKIDEFVLQSFIEDNSIKVSNYKWEYQIEGESTWNLVDVDDNTTASQITVNRDQFPAKTSRFRLTITTDTGEIESENTWLMGFAPICTGDTKTVTVFEQDFGTVPADYNGYNGDGKRFKYRADPQGNSGYTYAPYPRKINDGDYALVADPYWCGCGDGTNQPKESVENCTDKNRTTNEGDGGNWYRGYVYPTQSGIKFRDHTKNEQSDDATEYGLALMINYAENDDTLAYEHVLTNDELKRMVPGSTVRFSAHIASIAKYWSEQKSGVVSMTISIDYNPDSNDPDNTNWETWVSATQPVEHHDNWYPIVTEDKKLPARAGYYRIRIYSNKKSGTGYDILIDDIRLEACQPVINAHFEYDEGGTTVTATDVVMDDLSETYTVVVPKFDEGMLGDNPEVMLFTYDETTGSYKYIGKMTYNETSENYTFVVSEDYFDDIPDTVTFVAVATSKDNADTLAESIEHKLVDPTNSLECFRSEELLTMSIDCLADPTIEFAEGSVANICGELDSDGKPIFDYPSVRIRFANITDAVFYSITSKFAIPSGSSATGAVEYTSDFVQINSADLANGYVDVDLETFKDGLNWIPGVIYTVTVNVKEQYKDKDVCLRSSAEGVSFNIRYMPSFSADLVDAPEMCRGQEDKQIGAPDISHANTYLWQVSKDEGIIWGDAEGVNTNLAYTFPSEAENGWQYKLLISRVTTDFTCGPVESNPITLTVNDCEDYQLAQTIVADHAYCVGEEISLTWTIKNLNSVADQENVQVSSEALPDGVEFLSGDADAGISYDETTKQILWNIGTMQPEDQLTVSLKLRYSSYVTASVNKMLRIWISSSNSDTFATFEDQTNAGWYDRDQITLKGQTPKPTTSLEGQNYVSCAESGILDLETLLSGNYSDGVLTWYTDDALTQVLDPAEIDKSAVCDHDTYYVTFTDTERNLCASDTLQIHVTIKGISALPVTTSDVVDGTYEICAAESGTLSLSTLVEAPYETLTWYTDAALTQEFVPAEIDMTVAQDVTYYVTNTETGKCPSAAVAVRILIKANTEAPTVIVDAEGYAYNECAVVGSKPLSELVSSDNSGLRWYDEIGNEIDNPVFDTAAAGEYVYYVTNTRSGECESEKAEVKIKIKAISAKPTVDTDANGYAYNECAAESGTLSLSTLVEAPYETLTWYTDAALTQEFLPAEIDMTVAQDVTYYVTNTETDKCPSAAVAVRILIKANTEAPTVIVDAEGYAYNECAAAGSKSLSELIVSHDGTLQWYDAAGNPLGTGASFDTSEAGETTYYASSISADGCESAKAEVKVRVLAAGVAPDVLDYNECAQEGSKSLSELIVSHDGTLQWYDAAGNPLGTGASFDTSEAGETTYYASSISADGCESAKAEVKVRVVANSSALTTTSAVSEDGTFATCQATGSSILAWSDLIAAPHGVLNWYSDEDLQNPVPEPQVDLSVAQDVTYYVTNTEDGLCESLPVLLHIVVNAVPSAPVAAEDPDNAGYAYSECAAAGSKSLSELIVSHDGTLQWYDAAGNPLGTGALFDTSEAGETTYYASSISADGCESAKAEVKVRVLAAGVAPDVLDYNECAQEGSYNLDNLATTPQGTLEWFGDASATQLLSPATFDMAHVGNHTYYVRATASGECHSEVVPVSVVIRDVATASDISVDDLDVCPGAEATLTASTSMDDENMVFTWYSDAELGNSIGTGATLQISGPEDSKTYYVTVKGANTCENQPGDAAEAAVYAIAPIDNVRLEPVEERIGMGKETEKTLTVEPTDAYYTAVWTANGQVIADPDSYFPAKPYTDQLYKVVVTDECGNTIEASAITKVVWPTIITPQNMDGKNDDFLVGMQEDIHLEIFDRWGNVVYSGNDGWHQSEAAQKMPGVYYYIATLPDGTAKQGTIEVYK